MYMELRRVHGQVFFPGGGRLSISGHLTHASLDLRQSLPHLSLLALQSIPRTSGTSGMLCQLLFVNSL